MSDNGKSAPSMAIPIFVEREVKCGDRLGKGSYCHVSAVENITLTTKGDEATAKMKQVQAARKALAKRYAAEHPESKGLEDFGLSTANDDQSDFSPKLALKRVRYGDLPSADLHTARMDFLREVEILSLLAKEGITKDDPDASGNGSPSHPHVIELFGIGMEKGSGKNGISGEPSFVLLGLIRTTLSERMDKWKSDRGYGIYEALSLDVPNRRNNWVERLLVAQRVAKAIRFLHSRRVIYRDIKPDNVGFDYLTDAPKLFDFGLAKSIPNRERRRRRLRIRRRSTNGSRSSSDDDDDMDDEENGLFQLTAETGTLRYMAVEVGMGRSYGWSADVYSVGVLLHEIMALQVPFAGISSSQFRQAVWIEGQRLVIDPNWPPPLQELLSHMWLTDPTARPTMANVVKSIERMLQSSDQGLYPKHMVFSNQRRRSLW